METTDLCDDDGTKSRSKKSSSTSADDDDDDGFFEIGRSSAVARYETNEDGGDDA
jgi:hypothetical protein